MGRVGTAAAVVAMVGASACGSGATDAVTPTPEPTAAIASATTPAEPTPTDPPPPSTPTPTSAPTAGPEPSPTPDPATDEAAVIAAWERYLDLSIQARGKSPSPEALHYDSYVIGPSRVAVAQTEEDDQAQGQYLDGTAMSISPQVAFDNTATAQVTDCVRLNLVLRRRADGEQIGSQDAEVRTIGRLTLVAGEWLVSGQESGGECG